ncbi:MAG: aminotransferase class V-fold PLP-dependent enzyme [Pseudomonadota bacterium]
MPPLYLNACSHGLPSSATLQRMADHLAREIAVGPIQARTEARDEIAKARADVARVLNAKAGTGIGTGTAQLWSRIVGQTLRPKGRVLISAYEWGDHVRFLRAAATRIGCGLDVVPAGEAADPAAWAARLDGDVVAICVPQITSIEGRAFPVGALAALPRPDDALLVVDAAQGVGRVAGTGLAGADAVVATTRKWLRAPRQTAIFALSARAERGLGLSVADLEGTDGNAALRLGQGVALAEALALGLDAIQAGIGVLDRRLRDGLRHLDVLPAHTVGTVTLRVPRDRRDRVDGRLRKAGIVAKWSDPAREEPLSPGFGTDGVLRLSPHLYNGPEEIDAVLAALG